MIHQSYGNDLDMTTDEEDTYNKQPTNSTPDKNSSKQLNKNETNEKYSVRLDYFYFCSFIFTHFSTKLIFNKEFI